MTNDQLSQSNPMELMMALLGDIMASNGGKIPAMDLTKLLNLIEEMGKDEISEDAKNRLKQAVQLIQAFFAKRVEKFESLIEDMKEDWDDPESDTYGSTWSCLEEHLEGFKELL